MSQLTVTLDQSAIEEALLDYIVKMGLNINRCTAAVDMTAGRGVNGFSASITLRTKPAVQDTPVVRATTKLVEEVPSPVVENTPAKVEAVVEEEAEEVPEENEDSSDSSTIRRPVKGLFKKPTKAEDA